MRQNSDSTDARNGLLEQLQVPADCVRTEKGQPGDTTARPRTADHQSAPNCIGDSREDNGSRPDRLLSREGQGRTLNNKDVSFEPLKFNREIREPFWLPLGGSVFDEEVFPLEIAEIQQGLSKCRHRRIVGRQRPQPTDAVHSCRLQRLGHNCSER
jgi:hypothetical protein